MRRRTEWVFQTDQSLHCNQLARQFLCFFPNIEIEHCYPNNNAHSFLLLLIIPCEELERKAALPPTYKVRGPSRKILREPTCRLQKEQSSFLPQRSGVICEDVYNFTKTL